MDPIAAAGAAKSLTATAGAAAKNPFLQALLMPMAKAYGDHWGRATRERLAAAAVAKKRNNVEEHLVAVRPQLDDAFRPDPVMAEEWLTGSEEIDPVDEELSAAWRATLLAIGSGDPYRQRMLTTVRSMSPDEARAFVLLARRGQDRFGVGGPYGLSFYPLREHQFSLSDDRGRLEGLGLVRSRTAMLGGPSSRWGFSLCLLVLLAAFALQAASLIPPWSQYRSAEVIDGTMPLVLSVVAVLGLWTVTRAMTSISLTEFGFALARAILRMESFERSQPERQTTESSPEGSPTRKPRKRAAASSAKKAPAAAAKVQRGRSKPASPTRKSKPTDDT